MICAIYRSPKREQTYLFVEKKDDFSRVPEELLAQFGTPQFAMVIALDKREKLANADLARVKADLQEVGYYLQFPPPVEDLLSEHKELNI
ncbi:YcgL domain-containing protein [Providencia rettgeri]|uniref:YcgL domain-containing protein n=1 Tax=Providencia rettgeri TaxID=587 RepID=UPI0023AAB3B8|nr:YcgL domain-containing protein [Providencia rettgeri]ELR5150908.1 YcgL domain-containing protein [Providencia rettgeri]